MASDESLVLCSETRRASDCVNHRILSAPKILFFCFSHQIVETRPYRVPLAVGSDWSSEHPFDAPQLSVTQVGGTDHNVVARHWIYWSLIDFEVCLDVQEKVCLFLSCPPSLRILPLCFEKRRDGRNNKERQGGVSPRCSDLFSLFC